MRSGAQGVEEGEQQGFGAMKASWKCLNARCCSALLVGCALCLFATDGCQRRDVKITRPDQAVLREFDIRYRAYLDGNLNQARQSLESTLLLIEKSHLDPAAQAHCFCFTFGRLYVLELRAGRSNIADALLVKVRYWYLIHKELDGATKDEAAHSLKTYTGEKCSAFVDKWDRDHTDGKGPNYLRAELKPPL